MLRHHVFIGCVVAVGCGSDDLDTEMLSSPVSTAPVHMQIVAHEDDDFLFMNPDLQNTIAAGLNIVTIYVTDGEANGLDKCQADFNTIENGRRNHAWQRQRAVRAAYARMANLSLTPAQADAAAWTREQIVPDAGIALPHTVERYTLQSAPNIRLIFMNLREAGEDAPSGGPSIGKMFSAPNLVTNTIVPSCTTSLTCGRTSCNPDVPWQNYTRAELITVLTKLINMYQPVVIRTLDPQPFSIDGGGDAPCPVQPGYTVCFDNEDHTAVARYVDEIMGSYHGPNGTGHVSLVHYKGYSFINYPRNVGTGAYNDKHAAGEAYADSQPGDWNYSDSGYDLYYHAMYERYPGSTRWLERANNGLLYAVAVEDRKVKLWYENTVGGTWTGPVNLGGGAPIAPHLTLLKRPDGRLQIFATRLPLGMEHDPPVAPLQEVITLIQATPTSTTFGAWTSAGAPDSGFKTSVATAAIDGTGRVFIFARNSAALPVYTFFANNAWSAWAPLGTGSMDIYDGLAAITRDDGVIEVFATGRDGQIQRYTQIATSFGQSTNLQFWFTGAASPPTVTKNADGRLEIFYRETTSDGYGRVMTGWVGGNGIWQGPTAIYGDAGVGPVAAIRRGGTGHIMVFERNTWNGVSTTQQQAPNDVFVLQWNLRGGLIDEYPAAATDNNGHVVVIAKGSDGKLYYQRESSTVGTFGGWTVAGN